MHNQGLGSWIHRRRVKSATHTALISGDNRLSYDELAERVDRLANALDARGIRSGDRVAYLGENHPAFLETLFACGVLGAIFVPLNTRLAAPEIAFALTDSGSRILVHAASLAALAERGSEGTQVAERIMVADAAAPAAGTGSAGQASRIEMLDDVIAGASATHRDENVTLDDPALILYTSGTTGQPKGALLTHGNMTWNSFNVLVDYDFVSSDVALMIAPMFHVASLGMGVLPTLLKGGSVVLEPKFEPGRTLHLIEQHRATVISGVPTTYQLLCEHPDWATTDISSLQKLTCGGSAVPVRVLEAYEKRGLSFSGGYGLTETAPGATSLAPHKSREKAGSAGLPHFFTDVRVVDELGDEVARGEVGEIQISGPNVIREYWNRAEATADSYAGNVWFRSGDMGYFDEHGYLFISDRLKDMIISGGENIYPAEIELAISELHSVSSVAVIGVPDEKWGEVPCAIVTVRDGFTLDAADIQTHLRDRLARYKIPKRVVVVAEMPRTASGKIRKADLRRAHAG
ncbi:long-chain-fatty-acid--CoA ligase [Cryobacterium melibiosiphilum]|uniref:Long-chain-fatty-acid--CoA ligase n=1 Tax=Cryobacterium melibiosiphilum TaxID=995039 RepID=A0A3A5M864_9MICO|nr:long-chain fatty acid--CoA ligase [Cryobacterium melibiosiphilum]RJT85143.1 long-chain-fatty-acid--CoA ligase [Cryobacterium melibiosiphilum]